jgi:hypothetical protein
VCCAKTQEQVNVLTCAADGFRDRIKIRNNPSEVGVEFPCKESAIILRRPFVLKVIW